jgi:N-acetylglucosamine-6-phosphate deacetylase
LRPPDERELATLLEAGGGTVRIVTIAPELPGAEGLLHRALATGAVVALGHSDADYETARRAFDAGASHATHLFNAMAPLHHRRPGLVAAALLDETATVELVCDLVHVHPAVIELAARLVGERLVAVSDAMAASGLGGGGHTFGRRGVFVEGDRVSLEADDTILAGSVLTMEKAVHNLRTATGLSLGTCIAAATYSPVRSMLGKATQRPLPSAAFGAASGLGRLIGGGPADLVVLSPDLTVEATMVRGAVVYDPEGVLRRD